MTITAALVLSRTSHLVAQFKSRPRIHSVSFRRSKIRGRPARAAVSTAIMVRRLAQPVLRRQQTFGFS